MSPPKTMRSSKSPVYVHLKHKNVRIIGFFVILVLSCTHEKARIRSDDPVAATTVPLQPVQKPIVSSLKAIRLDGYLSFDKIHHASNDFGNIHHFLPSAVLYPKSVADISSTLKTIFLMGAASELTVAARGHGHSLQGQAQAHQGLVINMESLKEESQMKIHHSGDDENPYVDVSGGELWINILHETLKFDLAPKSWTDYLHLTVGGTLSNGGFSGQAFKHGPQINNVQELEVVTGKGDVVTCSQTKNSSLFFSVLGGLGQFGIITRARISLERAPKMVKWIRVLYSDFSVFTEDQEHLISSQNTFDYQEGFVIINRTGLLNNWRSSFNPKDPIQASQFSSKGKTLYCLEMAKYYDPDETEVMNKETETLLSELRYIQSTLFQSDVSYMDFLDRVHVSETKLREKGLWEIPHPWLNLFIPKSRIHDFSKEVFGGILTNSLNGPILIYPVNKFRWSNETSLVAPDEDVFYLVAFLSSALPSATGPESLEHVLSLNAKILHFCEENKIGVKQYLPHYKTQAEWRSHFDHRWEVFVQRKSLYDPLAILAPGQRIFQRAVPLPKSQQRHLT